MVGPTEALAAFAVRTSSKELPADVVRSAMRAILDCTGVALAGSMEPASQIMADLARAQGGELECTMWGMRGRTTAQSAALVNGIAAHALDFDDVSRNLPGHPTVSVLPAVMAAGERLGATGADVLAAFAIALEAELKLGKFTGQHSFDIGWHTTTTLGVIGAAVGVGKLLGLDLVQMRRAIGLAVAQASGVRQSHGTMGKPFHVGRAAQSGILAADLAARGFTGSERAVEGEYGYWDMFGGAVSRDGDALAAELGKPFDLVAPGIIYKIYPCCAQTHPSIDVARSLSAGLTADEIEKVVVEVPYTAPITLTHHRPTTGLAGKFSLEYCVAVALLDGQVGVGQFDDTAVNRPDAQSVLRRVEYRVPEKWSKETGSTHKGHVTVEVRLKDGTVRRGETTLPKGYEANSLTDEEMRDKFLDCATPAIGDYQARKALELLSVLDRLDNVRQLTEALAVQ